MDKIADISGYSVYINGAMFEEIIGTKIQPDVLLKVGGNDMRETTMSLYYPDKIIPNRKHHKKRIQKKWLKRYGYTTKPGECVGDFVPESTEPVEGIPNAISTTWRFKKSK